jgi:hypothetical protein
LICRNIGKDTSDMQMTIEGGNAKEFMDNFTQMANQMGFVSKAQAVAVAQAAVAKAAKPTEATSTPTDKAVEQPAESEKPAEQKPLEGEVLPPERPRRGRPPKSADPEKPAEAPKATEAPKAEAADKPLTTDDVRTAMKALASRCGVEAVGKLLAEFGVAKASEVPEAKIAEFVAKSEAWGAA